MNAERITQVLEQLRGMWELHVPAQYHPPAAPTGFALLMLGIGIAVLGARMARGGLTLAFALAGGLVAFAFRTHVNWNPPVVLGAGMLAGALCGFLLFRLWIGVAAAGLCAALAVGFYGSRNVAPHFVSYDSTHNFNGVFTVPEALPEARASDSAAADSIPTLEAHFDQFKSWCRGFWLYVQSQESDVNVWIAGIALGAGLFGFLLGSVLPRLTLIAGSASLGTLLVLSGFAALAHYANTQVYDAAISRPRVVGLVGVVLLVTSVVLQALLTRRPAAVAKSAPASAPR
jgi:hypothetical protein